MFLIVFFVVLTTGANVTCPPSLNIDFETRTSFFCMASYLLTQHGGQDSCKTVQEYTSTGQVSQLSPCQRRTPAPYPSVRARHPRVGLGMPKTPFCGSSELFPLKHQRSLSMLASRKSKIHSTHGSNINANSLSRSSIQSLLTRRATFTWYSCQ